jgi:hypothetical protein
MPLIGLFLFVIYAWLLFAIVVAPLLTFCGFAILWWRAWRIGGYVPRTAMVLVSCVGMTAAVVWMIGNDAVGVVRMVGAGL